MIKHDFIVYIYMIPVSGFVAPPPPNGLGPPRRRERSSMLVCVEASQHALHVYIHTYTQTIHTHIHTYRLIHTYIHTYIHPYMHVHTDTPPHPQGGGGGKTTCNRPAPPVHIDPCAPRPFGGGGWGGACRPGPYIYYMYKLVILQLLC